MQHVDAIYFVVKAVDTKINVIKSMRFMAALVKVLFGKEPKDIKDNIFILVTYQIDGGRSPSLDTVRKLGVHYSDWFAVNTSAFDLAPSSDMFDGIFSALSRGRPLSTAGDWAEDEQQAEQADPNPQIMLTSTRNKLWTRSKKSSCQ